MARPSTATTTKMALHSSLRSVRLCRTPAEERSADVLEPSSARSVPIQPTHIVSHDWSSSFHFGLTEFFCSNQQWTYPTPAPFGTTPISRLSTWTAFVVLSSYMYASLPNHLENCSRNPLGPQRPTQIVIRCRRRGDNYHTSGLVA